MEGLPPHEAQRNSDLYDEVEATEQFNERNEATLTMSLLGTMVGILTYNDNLDTPERSEVRPGIDVLGCASC